MGMFLSSRRIDDKEGDLVLICIIIMLFYHILN